MALSRSPFTPIGLARLAAVPLLLAGILGASPAAHAERVIVDSDYMETFGRSCVQNIVCSVPFTKVPRGQVLLVERVTCRFAIPSDAKINFAYLMRQTNDGAFAGPQTHLLPALRVGEDNDVIQSNDSARHAFRSGQIPAVLAGVVSASSFGSLSCSIFGTLRDETVR